MKMERQMKDLAEFAKVDNGNVEIKNHPLTYVKLSMILSSKAFPS